MNKVCEISRSDVLHLLDGLVARSLVIFDEDTGRYRLLETVRQYAAEALEDSREGEEMRRRHFGFFKQFAEDMEAEVTGPNQGEVLNKLDNDRENLRAALLWSRSEEGDVERGQRMSGRLARFWMIRGWIREGTEQVEALLAHEQGQDPTASRADALSAAGRLAWLRGDLEAAEEYFRATQEIRESLGDERGALGAMSSRGIAAMTRGNATEAKRLLEAALPRLRELDDIHGVAMAAGALGAVFEKEGRLDDALKEFNEALTIWQEQRHPHAVSVQLNNIANVVRKKGDLVAAREYASQALRLRLDLADAQGILWSIEFFGKLAIEEQKFSRAAWLFGAASELRKTRGIPLGPVDQAEVDAAISAARESLGEAEFLATFRVGAMSDLDEAARVAQAD